MSYLYNSSFNTIQYDIDLKQTWSNYVLAKSFNTIQYDIDLKPQIEFWTIS